MSTITFRKSPLFRYIALTVLTAFAGLLPAQPSYAQVAIFMPPPGQMIHITNQFEPPQMIGLRIDLKDPFSFDFIMDQGQNPMSADVKKEEYNKIIKYFLVSLAMPNKDMWVNLSPYESQRIIPQIFAQTEMGRDLLAQDYILKQFTASLMYPEDGLGKKFWDKVYSQAQARFGTTEINVNTFNKVWIVADHADVYQKDDTAFLIRSHLKVMLEQDYKAIEKNKEMFGSVQAVNTDETMDAKTKMASDVVREIIIPAIEKEVNEGKSFAAVRQVYNAEIMATWFKKTLRESLLGQVFANKSRISGQRVSDPQAMEKIYHQYLRAYKKGVFNYIREDATPDGQTIPRKYFSGGLILPASLVKGYTERAMASLPSTSPVKQEVQQELFSFENRTSDEVAKSNVDRVSTSFAAKFAGVAGAAVLIAGTAGAGTVDRNNGHLGLQPQAAPMVQSTNAPAAVTNNISAGVHGDFTVVGDNMNVVYPSTNASSGHVFGSTNGVNYVYGTGNHESLYWSPATTNWIPVNHPKTHVDLVEDRKTGEITESHQWLTERLAKQSIHDITTGTYATSQGNVTIGFLGDGDHLLNDGAKTIKGGVEFGLVPVVGAAEGATFVLTEGATKTYEGGKYVYKGGKTVGTYSWNGIEYVSKETGKGFQAAFNKKTGQFVLRAADREGNSLLDEGKSVVNAGIIGPVDAIIAPFNAHIHFLRTQDSDLRGQITNQSNTITGYRTQVSSLQVQIQQTGDANGALTDQLHGVQGKLASAVDHIGTLEQQLKQNAQDYQDSLNKAHQAVKDSEAKRAASELEAGKNADLLRGQIKDKDAQLAKLGPENVAQRQTIDTQRIELEKRLTEMNGLRTQLSTAGTNYTTLLTKFGSAQEQLTKMTEADKTEHDLNTKLQAAKDNDDTLNKVLLAALAVTTAGAFWMFMKGRSAKKEAEAARVAKEASAKEVARLTEALKTQQTAAKKEKDEFDRQMGEIQKGFGELQASHKTITEQFGAVQAEAQQEKALRLEAERKLKQAEEALAAALKAPSTSTTPAATDNLAEKATAAIARLQALKNAIAKVKQDWQDDLNKKTAEGQQINAGIPEQDWLLGKAEETLNTLSSGVIKEYGQVTDEQARPRAQRVYEERTGQVPGVTFTTYEQVLNARIAKLEADQDAKIASARELIDHVQKVDNLRKDAQLEATTREQKITADLPVITNQLKDAREQSNTSDFEQQKVILTAEMQKISGSTKDYSKDVGRLFDVANGAVGDEARTKSFQTLNEELAKIATSDKYAALEKVKSQLADAVQRQKEMVQKLVDNKVIDKAGLTRRDEVGGINLSDENLTINIKVDGAGMPLPAQFQSKAMMNLSGLTSVIRKITPMTPASLPALYALVQ